MNAFSLLLGDIRKKFDLHKGRQTKTAGIINETLGTSIEEKDIFYKGTIITVSAGSGVKEELAFHKASILQKIKDVGIVVSDIH